MCIYIHNYTSNDASQVRHRLWLLGFGYYFKSSQGSITRNCNPLPAQGTVVVDVCICMYAVNLKRVGALAIHFQICSEGGGVGGILGSLKRDSETARQNASETETERERGTHRDMQCKHTHM